MKPDVLNDGLLTPRSPRTVILRRRHCIQGTQKMKTKNMKMRRGFTLVELVVVLLIIGIIATIAAPKFFGSLSDAQDSSAAQTLRVVRDAIELYKANNPTYPASDGTEATLKTDLADYIRNGFPSCQVGKKDDSVLMQTDGGPLSADVDGSTSWLYDNSTGEIRINSAAHITY